MITLTAVYRGGLALAAVGLAGSVWPRQNADPDFDTRVRRPAFKGRNVPKVAIDEAHFNVHTAGGTYQPFAELIRRDGLRVFGQRERFREDTIAAYNVVVIANALGVRGVVEQIAGLGFIPEAIDPGEAAVIERYVFNGGSLLLIADHAPCGAAVKKLAGRFGVTMSDWWVEDPQHADPETKRPSFVLFDRASGAIGDHPATAFVEKVLTFTGQSLSGPGTKLLKLSPAAREYPRAGAAETEGRSAAGKAQALAFDHGKGRVAVLGEAAMLTAQIDRGLRFGMSRSEYDNRQFALSLMRWLARADD